MVTATLEKYNRIYGKKNDIFHYKYGHDMYCARVSEILYFKSNGRKVKISNAEVRRRITMVRWKKSATN